MCYSSNPFRAVCADPYVASILLVVFGVLREPDIRRAVISPAAQVTPVVVAIVLNYFHELSFLSILTLDKDVDFRRSHSILSWTGSG